MKRYFAKKETAPLVGFRAWKKQRDANGNLKIRSLSLIQNETIWPEYEPLHAVGNFDEGAGIYAFKLAQQLLSEPIFIDGVVAGRVALWGRYAEHEKGWRAEYAYPQEFWVRPETDPAEILELETAYGVPCSLQDLPKQQGGDATGFPVPFQLEILDSSLYDTEILEKNTVLFVRPMGSAWGHPLPMSPKSFLQTNLWMQGMLPNPQRFNVHRMVCGFFLNGSPVRLSHPVWRNCVLQFCIGDNRKPYWGGPAWTFAHPMFSLLEHTVDDLLRLEPSNTEQWDMVRKLLALAERPIGTTGPVAISQCQLFMVNAQCELEDIPKGMQIFVALEGELSRSVI